MQKKSIKLEQILDSNDIRQKLDTKKNNKHKNK